MKKNLNPKKQKTAILALERLNFFKSKLQLLLNELYPHVSNCFTKRHCWPFSILISKHGLHCPGWSPEYLESQIHPTPPLPPSLQLETILNITAEEENLIMQTLGIQTASPSSSHVKVAFYNTTTVAFTLQWCSALPLSRKGSHCPQSNHKARWRRMVQVVAVSHESLRLSSTWPIG